MNCPECHQEVTKLTHYKQAPMCTDCKSAHFGKDPDPQKRMDIDPEEVTRSVCSFCKLEIQVVGLAVFHALPACPMYLEAEDSLDFIIRCNRIEDMRKRALTFLVSPNCSPSKKARPC